MKKNLLKNIILTALCLSLLLSFTSCEKNSTDTSTAGTSETSVSETVVKGKVEVKYSSKDMDASWDESKSTKVSLDKTYTITKEGTYVFSGTLKDGQIIVDVTDQEKVQIVLNNATISSSDGPAIYVKNADKVFVTLADGSKNTVSDGKSYNITGDEPWGAIFSKSDLTINGTGKLTVNGNKNNGIVSKDDLRITNGTIKVTAVNNGIKGTDSVGICGGTITVSAKHDGIKSSSTKKDGKGFVSIDGGSIHISDVSSQGIQAATVAQITGGKLTINSENEGVQGQIIYISGGKNTIDAKDDGLNATNSSSSQVRMDEVQEGVYIEIVGGKNNITANGDGIDSNGDLSVSGGTTIIQGPENDGNGSIDYPGDATITGGTVIAFGSSDMAQNFGEKSTQASLLFSGDSHESDVEVSITDADGNTIYSGKSAVRFSSLLISTPDMDSNDTYTITIGSKSENVSMSGTITTSGNAGMMHGPQGGPR